MHAGGMPVRDRRQQQPGGVSGGGDLRPTLLASAGGELLLHQAGEERRPAPLLRRPGPGDHGGAPRHIASTYQFLWLILARQQLYIKTIDSNTFTYKRRPLATLTALVLKEMFDKGVDSNTFTYIL
eukprot:scaffold508421_cov20-Prasinocladus_malaysianus.AAC.1